MSNPIQPHDLPEGDYTGRLSEEGQVVQFRVMLERHVGAVVQFFCESEGWLPKFVPNYPASPVYAVAKRETKS